VVSEIRIYVEGGGDQRSGKAAVQVGFSKFLSSLKKRARERHILWYVAACGSRQSDLPKKGIGRIEIIGDPDEETSQSQR